MTATWKQILYTYPCPTCGAPPDQPCRTSTGNRKNEPHADRGRNGHVCPGLGSRPCRRRLPDTAAAGDLCPKCRLVEDLLIERYSRRPR